MPTRVGGAGDRQRVSLRLSLSLPARSRRVAAVLECRRLLRLEDTALEVQVLSNQASSQAAVHCKPLVRRSSTNLLFFLNDLAVQAPAFVLHVD